MRFLVLAVGNYSLLSYALVLNTLWPGSYVLWVKSYTICTLCSEVLCLSLLCRYALFTIPVLVVSLHVSFLVCVFCAFLHWGAFSPISGDLHCSCINCQSALEKLRFCHRLSVSACAVFIFPANCRFGSVHKTVGLRFTSCKLVSGNLEIARNKITVFFVFNLLFFQKVKYINFSI